MCASFSVLSVCLSVASTVLSVARKLSDEEVVDDSIVAAVEFENKLSSAWKESSIPQNTTAPTQDTLRSIQDTTSAAQATATSTQDTTLSSTSIDTNSFMKTAQYIAEPAQDTTTKRTQDTIEHAQDTTKHAQDTTKCAQDTSPITTQSHSLSDSLENIAEPSSNEQIRLSTVDRQRNGRAEKQVERKMVSTAAGGGPGHHGACLLQSSLTEHTLRVVTERVKRMDSQ